MSELSPELVAVVVGGLLSLLFTYIPGLNSWFAALTADLKKASMGILTILASVVLYVLACTPSLGFPYMSCPTGGLWELLAIVFLALTANQGVFSISPTPGRVKAAKAKTAGG